MVGPGDAEGGEAAAAEDEAGASVGADSPPPAEGEGGAEPVGHPVGEGGGAVASAPPDGGEPATVAETAQEEGEADSDSDMSNHAGGVVGLQS